MKKVQVITLFPDLVEQALSYGVLGSAIKNKMIHLEVINPRDFAVGVHQAVDDKPYGGGDGMLMTIEPLEKALGSLVNKGKVIHLSPVGKIWTDSEARSWAGGEEQTLTFICGRYAGIDQRFINNYVDVELSVGDFILSGGEFAFLCVLDSYARHLPGVLGNPLSHQQESFSDGLLEAPQFTRPKDYVFSHGEESVPDILLSGHHKNIEKWKKQVSLIFTFKYRPDLIHEGYYQKQVEESLSWALKQPEKELKSCGFSHVELLELQASLRNFRR